MAWMSRRIPGTFQHWSFCTPPAVSKGSERGGTNWSPPFEGIRQRGIAAAQFLQIVGRVGRIGERGDDIDEDEPPLVVMEETADLPLFEKGHVAQLDLH